MGSEVFLEGLAKAIVRSCRTSLAKGITLVESSLPCHKEQAVKLIELLSGCSSNRKDKQTFVIGVAGPPGAGKGTQAQNIAKKYSFYIGIIPFRAGHSWLVYMPDGVFGTSKNSEKTLWF